jgi:single-strand DNA-binding protein
MRGIQCTFTGKCGQDAELKTSKSGKPWLSVSVVVDMEASEEATTWVRVAVFGQLATRLYPELKKGTEVYCEGRLRLDSWTGRDGRERTGLSVAAAKVEVLGKIGFDPYQRKPTDETRAPLKQPELEGQGRREREDLPF